MAFGTPQLYNLLQNSSDMSTDLHKLTNTLLGNNTVTLASLLSSIQLVGESQLKKKKLENHKETMVFLLNQQDIQGIEKFFAVSEHKHRFKNLSVRFDI